MPETSAPPKTLMEAILRVQQEVPSLKLGRDAEGQIGSRKYKYLTLDKLHAEVLPLLTRNGLVWITRPGIAGPGEPPVMFYELLLAAGTNGVGDARTMKPPGEMIAGTMPLFLGENTMQAYGSALSYAARYALLRVLGIAPSGEDDDGQAAAKTRRPPAPIRTVHAKDLPTPDELDEVDKAKRVLDRERLMTPEELEILGKAVGESGQKLSLLLASVGAEDLDALTVAQGRSMMRKISEAGSRK